MKKATLNYVISDVSGEKSLILENSSLYDIDMYTSQYKGDIDLINSYYNPEKIRNFLRENPGKVGNVRVFYAKNIQSKQKLLPLYDSKREICMYDDINNGNYTEIELARKLLFNSQGQLFTRLLLSSDFIPETFDYKLSISFHEYLLAKKKGLIVEQQNDSYYISFSELFKYRLANKKLGSLRELYEDMLDAWKDNLMNLNDDDFYYYSRQLRILMNKYEKMKLKHISVNNLKVSKKRKSIVSYTLKSNSNEYGVLSKNSNGKRKIKDVS